MNAIAKRGMGWVPDLPDHRDKQFRRAVRHADEAYAAVPSAGGRPVSQGPRRSPLKSAPVVPVRSAGRRTFEGWRDSAELLEKRVEDKAAPGVEERLRRAKAWAFSEKVPAGDWRGTAAGGGRVGRSLLLERPPSGRLPRRVDLRPFLSPVEQQEKLGSCTAHAVMGLVEYLQIATTGQYVDGSRLFLYKATRELLKWQGDTGAYIRETIKAMRLFGVCPEEYWPYTAGEFETPPPAFCYAFASNYKAMSYCRLEGLEEIRRSVAQGYPVAFGFTCFDSLFAPGVGQTGFVPYPDLGERSQGGHAVLAVGYLDADAAGDVVPEYARNEEGWLVVRNSWGEEWGQGGYGLLPYRFVTGSGDYPPLADDFWTLARLDVPEFDGASPAPFTMAVGVGA